MTLQQPDRNLALELVRVTEVAALAAARWVGRGEKEAADGAAVAAMRAVLSTVSMDGVVVIGEGEKDEAPMLANGERVGDGSGPLTDIAVDPIEGTTPTALGRTNAMAVIAVAERGAMFDPGPSLYMDKLAVGPAGVGVVDITRSPAENLQALADATSSSVSDLTVVVLERDRHVDLIEQVRAAGARLRLISDNDVAAAIAAALDGTGIDLLLGVGGSPEAVIAATAIKCLDGQLQCRLWPRDDDERRRALAAGYDLEKVLDADDLVRSDNCFFAATGITNGDLFPGVTYDEHGASTHSLAMRTRSGTVRRVDARHPLSKLRTYAVVDL